MDSWEAIDQNSRGSLTAVSTADGKTIVRLWADPITHRLLVDEAATISVAYYNETPSGAINGVNTTFTLANTPLSNSLVLTLNRQPQILTTDYTIAGNIITYTSPPPTGLTPHNAIYAVTGGIISGTVSVETPGGLINGSNTTYTTVNDINTVIALELNGQYIDPSQYSYTAGSSGFTMGTAIPSSYSNTPFTIIYV